MFVSLSPSKELGWLLSAYKGLRAYRTDPESPRLRDMIRNEYTEVMKVDNGVLGSDVSVYVRKI